MAPPRRRVSYVIPAPADPPPRLQLPPHGVPRNGATGPILIPIQSAGSPPPPTPKWAQHPRHRLGVSCLALDTSTQLVGRASPDDRERAALTVAKRALGLPGDAIPGTASAELRSDGVLRIPNDPALSLGDEFSTDLFRDFAHLFASPAVSRLHISVASNLYPTCLDSARMAALLAAFPQLAFLRVGRKCHDLFRYLAQTDKRSESGGPPCPHLDHLIALWSVSWEEEFRTSCDLVEKTLAQRAALGLRLSILDLRFRRLYGLKQGQGEVDLEEIRSGLVRRLRPLAGMVVVNIET